MRLTHRENLAGKLLLCYSVLGVQTAFRGFSVVIKADENPCVHAYTACSDFLIRLTLCKQVGAELMCCACTVLQDNGCNLYNSKSILRIAATYQSLICWGRICPEYEPH